MHTSGKSLSWVLGTYVKMQRKGERERKKEKEGEKGA